jgi:hypothetical protein
MPPGAPPDSTAPRLLKITPDSGALNARVDGITFLYNEVVSERPQGAADLAGMFLISPYDGQPRVSWKRSRIEIAPRGGIRSNTTYVVRVLPGIVDLRGNDDSLGRTIVFSTGPSIASGLIRGVVFDWAGERPAARAFVAARPLADTTTAYIAVADSLGSYLIQGIPAGRYSMRAFADENRNRLLEPREMFDSVTVAITDSIVRDFLAIVRDTLGPGIAAVNRADSLTLRVQFDRGLDSTQTLGVGEFILKAQDSSVVPLRAALTGSAFDKARDDSIRLKAIQDSVNRARQQDSVRRADSVRAAAAGRPLGRRPGAPPPGVQAARQDTTTRRPPPKPPFPAPENEMVLRLAQPLRPGTAYRLRAINIRSFLGHSRTSERQFQVPRAAPTDTTRRDTTARRDTVGIR